MFSRFDGAPFPCKGHICLWLISSHSWVHTVSLTTVPCPELDTILFGNRKPFKSFWNVPEVFAWAVWFSHPDFMCHLWWVWHGDKDLSGLSGVQCLTQCHPRFSSWQNQGLNLSLLLSIHGLCHCLCHFDKKSTAEGTCCWLVGIE